MLSLPLKKYPSLWIALFLLVVILLILIGNLLSFSHNGFHVYDLGIYHQAITELGSDNLNPYITVHNLKIFNDHFDPIIFLAVPFVKLFSNALEATIIFEFLWYLMFIFLASHSVYKQNIKEKKDLQIKAILLMIWMIVFSRGLLTGILYPIHPTFWSIVPLFFLCKYLQLNHLKGILLSSFALCLFKEIFPLALICLSFYYALIKNWRYFISIFLIGAVGSIFIFYLRPLWLGEVYSHGGLFFAKIFEVGILNTLIKADYIALLKLLYPFFIPIYLLCQKEIKKKKLKHPLFPILFLIIPLLAVHFIGGKIWFQYSAITIGPLLSILSLTSIPLIIVKNKKLLIAVYILFYLNGASRHQIQWEVIARTIDDLIDTNYIESSNGRYTSRHRKLIKQVETLLNKHAQDKKILATGGVIPRIIAPGREIYHLGGYFRNEKGQSKKRHLKIFPYYDILLLGFNSYSHPMIKKQINKIKKSCGRFASKTYVDNDFHYMIEGKIPWGCIIKN